ncbi:MAG: peptidase [Candidatus Parabeggiatoa sp. nov. 2]|nr:MAG: peptidase [Gammaproteobacteria bacterium]
MFENTRRFLERIHLPAGDLYNLPVSEKRFSDGAHFRIEVPTVNNIETAQALLEESDRLKVTINRVTETYGMFRHPKAEIEALVQLCQEYGCELLMSTGPRAAYDTSATAHSKDGKRIGYRLRGQEQLIRGIEDIKRGIEFGVKYFVIYDEGLLWVLNQMRQAKELPAHIRFKISAHCGHSNAAAFKLLESIGADSINPVRDLQLPMIASLRDAVDVAIDCHVDCPPSSGGFVRSYEAPEIVRIAAPVHLKTGNSALSRHGENTTAKEGKAMAKQVAIVIEMMQRYFPEAVQSARLVRA